MRVKWGNCILSIPWSIASALGPRKSRLAVELTIIALHTYDVTSEMTPLIRQSLPCLYAIVLLNFCYTAADSLLVAGSFIFFSSATVLSLMSVGGTQLKLSLRVTPNPMLFSLLLLLLSLKLTLFAVPSTPDSRIGRYGVRS